MQWIQEKAFTWGPTQWIQKAFTGVQLNGYRRLPLVGYYPMDTGEGLYKGFYPMDTGEGLYWGITQWIQEKAFTLVILNG